MWNIKKFIWKRIIEGKETESISNQEKSIELFPKTQKNDKLWEIEKILYLLNEIYFIRNKLLIKNYYIV